MSCFGFGSVSIFCRLDSMLTCDGYFIQSFVVIKVIIGVNLIGYATRRRSGMEARQAADVVNDFGRDPIGEGKEEQVRFIVHLCGFL